MDAIDRTESASSELREVSKKTFPVIGITCAGCASSVQNMLVQMKGVYSANVNFANSTVLLEFDSPLNVYDVQNLVR